MGSDRRTFFNQLVNVGALSGLAAMLPSDAFARVESGILGETPETGSTFLTSDDNARTHTFHASAQALESQAVIQLPEGGGFRSHFIDSYDSGDGISFRSAYMHVAGMRSSETGYGWATLATTFVTGLRVQDVVTADLAFAQISTQHPLQGHMPSVSFLGTRFENLRITGREVQPVLELGVCGARPQGDRPYVEDKGFLSRVSRQHEHINTALGLSDSAREKYHWAPEERSEAGKVECSLVTSVGQAEPGTSFGHIVELSGGGTVRLAELTVDRASFHLSMFSVQTGKPHKKKIVIAYTNGTTNP